MHDATSIQVGRTLNLSSDSVCKSLPLANGVKPKLIGRLRRTEAIVIEVE